MRTRFTILIILCFLAFLSMGLSLFKGSAAISTEILLDVRFPRTLSAFVAGGLLALAGALMQILLRNPLADPYVLGISGGAAVVMLLMLLLGISGIGLIGGAWIGSIIAIVLVFALAKRKTPWNSQRLLLTGIALASGFSALISFLLLISSEYELRGMLFWMMGDLSYAHFPTWEMLCLILGLLISLCLARQLNILLRGESAAKTLGVSTERLHIILYLLSSALTATAVTLAGCIGFVGLIVPHMLRLIGLHDQRFLLPGVVLLGGTLVTGADLCARTLWSPQQLPVGMMMALIGIPVFLLLLQKESSHEKSF